MLPVGKKPGMFIQTMDGLANMTERALGAILICAVLLNVINVVGRYVFGIAYLSADELEVFGLVFITFLGAVVVTWRGQNLRMDVIQASLPLKWRIATRLLEAVVGFVLCGFVAFHSFRYVQKVYILEQSSDMAGMPMWIPHSTLFVGFAMIAFMLAVHGVLGLFQSDKTGRTDAEAAVVPAPPERLR